MKIDHVANQRHSLSIYSQPPSHHKPVLDIQLKTKSNKEMLSGNIEELLKIYGEKQLKKIGMIECETCADRSYIDGSDDPGVSFKSPGKIDPDVSASTVMAHELEHVRNERADAKLEDREIVSQSVTLHNSICPECGSVYVSGGETKTLSKTKETYGLSPQLLKGGQVDLKL